MPLRSPHLPPAAARAAARNSASSTNPTKAAAKPAPAPAGKDSAPAAAASGPVSLEEAEAVVAVMRAPTAYDAHHAGPAAAGPAVCHLGRSMGALRRQVRPPSPGGAAGTPDTGTPPPRARASAAAAAASAAVVAAQAVASRLEGAAAPLSTPRANVARNTAAGGATLRGLAGELGAAEAAARDLEATLGARRRDSDRLRRT